MPVRRGLADAAWVHIACHATADFANPSASRLVLAGGDLTVADIGRLRILPEGQTPNRRFAAAEHLCLQVISGTVGFRSPGDASA